MPALASALSRLAGRAGVTGASRRSAARYGRLVATAGLVVAVTAATGSGVVLTSSDAVEPAGRRTAVPNAWAAELASAPVNSWAVELASAPENFWAQELLALLVVGPTAASEPSASPAGLTPEQLAIVIDPRVSAGGIPDRVLGAYRSAAARLAAEQPACQVPWELIAAIGRVESAHGTFGGAAVAVDGRIMPEIIGLRLDGAGPVAEIRDTDGGVLDRDVEYDRAVGPMQFIPGTWARHGADGDGDGRSDPHDIDDAALGTGRYLCASGSVGTSEGKVRAVYSYNHSYDYVRLVLSLAAAYAGASPESFGTGLLPAPVAPPPPVVPPPVVAAAPVPAPVPVGPAPVGPAPVGPGAPAGPVPPTAPGPAATPGPAPAPAPAPVLTPRPDPTPTPSPSPSPTQPAPSPEPSPEATPTPSPSPAVSPAP